MILEVFGFFSFFVFLTMYLMVFTVRHNHVVLTTRFGKFNALYFSGVNFKIPYIDTVDAVLNLAVFQLNITVELKYVLIF